MKELYFFDETFYWGRSGRRATVIEAECELTQSVRPDELRADFDQIFAAPMPVTEVSPMVVKSDRQKDSAFCTYGISYAGHLDFSDHQGGDAIARQVQTVGVSAGSYSYPLWIIACEYKGILRMRLVRQKKNFWIMLIPALFMTTVCSTYVFISRQMLHLPEPLAYGLGIACLVVAAVWFTIWYNKQERNQQ